MICDAHDVENGARLSADLCIVGAGAAGITLALQFEAAAASVILLEAGGEHPDAATDALYDGEVADPALHSPPGAYRERRFGGTTTIWGGRCMPLDPIDFERRDWIAGSGWPFGIETLLPFYAEANRLCEAGEFAYTAAAAFPRGMRPMLRHFAGPRFTDDTLERFSCPTDFGHRYRKRLMASRAIRVVLGANVTNIRTAEGAVPNSLARATGVDVARLDGARFRVQARLFVLAAGGLEIPRLLLASRDGQPAGIGNLHDQVGRNYMCHLAGTLGELRIPGGARAVSHGYQIADDGTYCRRRLALTASSQRELRVSNFIARLHHPRIPDPRHRTGPLSALYLARGLIRYEYRKRLLGDAPPGDRLQLGLQLQHLSNLLRDPVDTARFLAGWLRTRTLADRKFPSIIVRPASGAYSIDFHAEQEPNPQSRVTLAETRDATGMNRLRVDWRHTDGDIRTVREALRVLASELHMSGCGRLRYDETTLAREMLRDGAYGGHHIGTARMSVSPRQGVVDAECRVHGLANLYIAGSAVFPTSGQANPTLTIVALALRLARTLKLKMANCNQAITMA